MQEIKKIVVPVDFGKHTDKIVEFATDVANKFAARLSFFHVAKLYESYSEIELVAFPSMQEAEKELLGEVEKKMAALVENCKVKPAGCTGKVVQGNIVKQILAFVKQENAGLVIIGTHGSKNLDEVLLGSVARQVVKKAHCPVLTLNPFN